MSGKDGKTMSRESFQGAVECLKVAEKKKTPQVGCNNPPGLIVRVERAEFEFKVTVHYFAYGMS